MAGQIADKSRRHVSLCVSDLASMPEGRRPRRGL